MQSSCKIFAAVLCALGLLVSMGCGRDPAPSVLEVEAWENELFERINTDRNLADVPTLDRLEILDRAAAEIAFLAIRERLENLDIHQLLAEHGFTAYLLAGHSVSSFYGRPTNMVLKAIEEINLTNKEFLTNTDFRSCGLAIRYFDGYYFVVFVGAHLLETDDDGNLKPVVTAQLWARDRVRPYEIEHFELLNKTRIENKCTILEPDDQLAALARAYAEKMLREGFFSHNDPHGKSFVQRIDEAPLVKYRAWGENLASMLRPNNPPSDAMTELMDSPGHRENILRKEFTHVGVATATDGRWWMFVQIFGSAR